MAQMITTNLSAKTPASEVKVINALKPLSGLVVLHSVVWQSRRNHKQSDGEADFIIIDPNQGILVLEVKGGNIAIDNGVWYSTDKYAVKHKIKDPFQQAKDSKHALLKYLSDVCPQLKSIPVIHAVCFPDIILKESISANAPRKIIIDRLDLKVMQRALSDVFAHWGSAKHITQLEVEKLKRLLAPTLFVIKRMGHEVEDLDKALVELTSEQVQVLHSLKRCNFAVIYGKAGTGKTILALEKAIQLNESGFKVGLLCFNTNLKTYINQSIGDKGITVNTFHGFVIAEAKRAGLKVPQQLDDQWFENGAVSILQDITPCFDAIIIDEAQDFSPEWLLSLQRLIPKDGIFYLFADPLQEFYRKDWQPPVNTFPFELILNCRNTRQIAEKVFNVLTETPTGKLVDGPSPQFVEAPNTESALKAATDILEHLLLIEGVKHSDIVVLTDSNATLSLLRTRIVADYSLTSIDKYGVTTETIYKFKGLERNIVIVIIGEKPDKEKLRSLGYVALSRAKVGLYLITSAGVKDELRWGD
mgnify:CR=1 FL=1